MRRRSHAEIIRDLLSVLTEYPRGLVRTRVMGYIGVNTSTFNPIIDLLLHKGYISITDVPDHKRATLVHITSEGNEALNKLNEGFSTVSY